MFNFSQHGHVTKNSSVHLDLNIYRVYFDVKPFTCEDIEPIKPTPDDIHRLPVFYGLQIRTSLIHITAHRFVAFAREGEDMIYTDGFIVSHTYVRDEVIKKRILPPKILFANPISQ